MARTPLPLLGMVDGYGDRKAVRDEYIKQGMRVGFDVDADRKTGKPRAANLRLL